MRRPNVFASAHLDRAHKLRRDDEALRAARADASARVAVVWRSQSLIVDHEGPRAALLPASELSELIVEAEQSVPLVLLGVECDVSYFALDISDMETPGERAALRDSGDFVDLRQVGSVLEPDEGALLAYARAMMSWHRKHLFCGACGSATEAREAGHLRVCTDSDCEAQSFPRTDPAVIMLVHDGGDRCLLGRQSSWPPGVYSALAGFVEPGESLEHAVMREVHEEAGIRIDSAEYHSSQPWPFPSSIMLGFFARASTSEVRLDLDELEDALWLSRDELVARYRMRELRLPPRLSIARRLIDDWLEEGAP